MKNNFNFDEIEFATIEDASAVLGKMCDIIKKYGYVTVADFYDLINLIVHVPYNMSKFGWSNLSSAHIKDSALGYTIVFPEPKIIANLKANTNKKSVQKYNKIVRDRIPDIIASEGKVVKYTHFNPENDDHYIRRLLDKLSEELSELYNAVEHDDDLGRDAVIEEMADVAEVFDALARNLNISHDEILLMMKAKAVEKGTFENGTYLIEVEEGK